MADDVADHSISSLVEYICQEEFDKPDLAGALEVADRVNQNKKECKETIQALIRVFKKTKKQVVLNGVLLLETLTKNCDMRFHYEIARKDLCEALLRLLKRRRGKVGFFDKMVTGNEEILDEIETKVLYLIQLWADTFMMHEDEFKPVQETYRILRKEGVKFPPRDANERFMIKFKGVTSPVFESGELTQNPSNPQAEQDEGERSTPVQKAPPKKKKKERQLQDSDNEIDDPSYLANARVSYEEIKMIKSTIGVLHEIKENATGPQDMKSSSSREILNDLVKAQKRLSVIIQFENFENDLERMNCLDLNDAINEAVNTYRERYVQLKESVNRGEKPISISDQKAIDLSTRGKEEKQPSAPVEKKKAISISKADGKPSKLAPPSGWNNPNPKISTNNTNNASNASQPTQSAQQVMNLLDFDDEVENSAPINQQSIAPKPQNSDYTVHQTANTITVTNTNSAPMTGTVDLFDLDYDSPQPKVKEAEMMKPVMAETPTSPFIKTSAQQPQNNVEEQPKVTFDPDDLFGADDDNSAQVSQSQPQEEAKQTEEDDDDDFFSSMANRKK